MEVLAADIKEIFENFTETQWINLQKRLVYYYVVHYRDEPRLEMEDLIQEAIADLCSGRRHWRPEKADLATCICGVMRSKASHFLEKENRMRLQSIEEISLMATPRNQSIDIQFEVCEDLREIVSRDPLLTRMVEFIIQDPQMNPRDMPDLLPDLSKGEIHNAYRRLHKLITKLKEECGNE